MMNPVVIDEENQRDSKVGDKVGRRLQKQRWLLYNGLSAIVAIAFLATRNGDRSDEDTGKFRRGAVPPPTAVPPPSIASLTEENSNPCSSYSEVITVTSSDSDVASFCGQNLTENTAYVLTESVTCAAGLGPWLPSNVCLDCRGNSIRGIGDNVAEDVNSKGIFVPASSKNAGVHNCIVENFVDGIDIKGDGAYISNVHARNNANDGISNSGTNSRVECSVVNNNLLGIRSFDGSINVTGVWLEHNDHGAWFYDLEGIGRADAVVSCSRIRFNGFDGIHVSEGADEVIIRDSIVAANGDDNIDIEEAEIVLLNNVAVCAATDKDIEIGSGSVVAVCAATDEGIEVGSGSIVFDGLTCDHADPPVACEKTCGSSMVMFPGSCKVCKNGVGTYMP